MAVTGFSTRTGVACPGCGAECRFAESTDVLAARPVRVEIHCPACARRGSTILREGDRESFRPWGMAKPTPSNYPKAS